MITPGMTVGATDANGKELRLKALSGVEPGHSFPVVWVEVPVNGGGTDRMPWPAEYVRPLVEEETDLMAALRDSMAAAKRSRGVRSYRRSIKEKSTDV